MSKQQTASQVAHERMAKEAAYHRCQQQSPNSQAEAIARHYTSLAMTAVQLKRILEVTKYDPDPTWAAAFRDYLVHTIKCAHLYDFGIALEWKEPTPPDWPEGGKDVNGCDV